MRRLAALAFVLAALCLPCVSRADMRALLVACSDFVTQPDLGSEISGNVQMIASALLGITPRPAGLSIEDGTIGTRAALSAAVTDAFSEADETDLSILYICTHGVLSSSDDELSYLLLGDGKTETAVSGRELCAMLAPIQGEKLLIIDACFSGALIGRGFTPEGGFPPYASAEPFLADSSIHVLTSASGHESSWYYDSSMLETGAVSYFASAFSAGLGLYGSAEADLNGDGAVDLAELHRHLNAAVPSSSCQLLSASAETLFLPAVQKPMLSRPLSGFSYGELLLTADAPTLDFSFTVTSETAVQYRLIDFDQDRWNWEKAKTFLDSGEGNGVTLSPGRKTRTLTLEDVAPHESGYLMLQVFSLQDSRLILCSERLIAVQPDEADEPLRIACPETFTPGAAEMPISLFTGIPAEVTVSVYAEDGALVRRICRSMLTHPSPGDISRLFWDGKTDDGSFAPQGSYTVCAEAILSGKRSKAVAAVELIR